MSKWNKIKERLKNSEKLIKRDGVIWMMYFIEGVILTIPDVAMRLFLSEDLALTPAEVQLLYGVMLIPWLSKPIYGFVSDSIPLFGYRRIPYLFLSELGVFISWLLLAFSSYIFTPNGEIAEKGNFFVFTKILAIFALICQSFFVCFAGVVNDSIVVEKMKKYEKTKENLGKIQSFCFISRIFGSLLATIFSGVLVDVLGIMPVFAITSFIAILAIFLSFFVDDSRIDDLNSFYHHSLFLSSPSSHHAPLSLPDYSVFSLLLIFKFQIKLIFAQFFGKKKLWKPALFILIISSAPSSYTSFYYYLYYQLHISSSLFGFMSFLSSLAGLAGIFSLLSSSLSFLLSSFPSPLFLSSLLLPLFSFSFLSPLLLLPFFSFSLPLFPPASPLFLSPSLLFSFPSLLSSSLPSCFLFLSSLSLPPPSNLPPFSPFPFIFPSIETFISLGSFHSSTQPQCSPCPLSPVQIITRTERGIIDH